MGPPAGYCRYFSHTLAGRFPSIHALRPILLHVFLYHAIMILWMLFPCLVPSALSLQAF